MKRINLGFLAVVALLAMSFTIASKSEVFKSKKAFAITSCFVPNAELKQTCTTPDLIQATTACSVADDYVGARIFALNTTNPIDELDIAFECPSPQDVFCCLQVEEDTRIDCLSQPTFNLGEGAKKYKVKSIYCKD